MCRTAREHAQDDAAHGEGLVSILVSLTETYQATVVPEFVEQQAHARRCFSTAACHVTMPAVATAADRATAIEERVQCQQLLL